MGKERHHRRRPLAGRHLLTFGALGLLGVSGYELWIRLEDFWAWTQGIRHLSAVQGTSFISNMGIILEAPEMRALGFKMLFLCAAILINLGIAVLVVWVVKQNVLLIKGSDSMYHVYRGEWIFNEIGKGNIWPLYNPAGLSQPGLKDSVH